MPLLPQQPTPWELVRTEKKNPGPRLLSNEFLYHLLLSVRYLLSFQNRDLFLNNNRMIHII